MRIQIRIVVPKVERWIRYKAQFYPEIGYGQLWRSNTGVVEVDKTAEKSC